MLIHCVRRTVQRLLKGKANTCNDEVMRLQSSADSYSPKSFVSKRATLKILETASLFLVLIACSQQEATTPTISENEAKISSLSLINAEAGQVLPGLESIADGSTVDLSEFGATTVHLQANVSSDDVSKVQLMFDGESYTDDTAPYTFPGPDAAGWRLEDGEHTFSATPYRTDGSSGTPFQVSFSVTAPDYQRYLYVFRTSAIDVYNIDNGHELVKSLKLPGGIRRIWGAVAHAESGRLYIAYNGRDKAKRLECGLIAYDLIKEEVIWEKLYKPFVDSPAVTQDGKTIYLSSGEATDRGDFWFVLNAADGSIKDKIEVFKGSHNTIVGHSDKSVYMGSVRYPYLVVADTATNKVTKEIGPFRAGVRPFTVNGKETLAFVNVNRFLGFEVGDISSGKVLYSVQVEGFQEGPFKRELSVQSHGIALTPDEQEVWVADNGNKYLHLYDVSGLPEKAPSYLESIKMPSSPNWVQFSRDGRFAYSSGGEVIDTATRQFVAKTSSAKVRIQIDFADDLPANAYVRYGLGYVTD